MLTGAFEASIWDRFLNGMPVCAEMWLGYLASHAECGQGCGDYPRGKGVAPMEAIVEARLDHGVIQVVCWLHVVFHYINSTEDLDGGCWKHLLYLFGELGVWGLCYPVIRRWYDVADRWAGMYKLWHGDDCICNFFGDFFGLWRVIWKPNQIDSSNWNNTFSDSALCECIHVLLW